MVLFDMAGDAIGVAGEGAILAMTGLAVHWLVNVIDLVTFEAETSQLEVVNIAVSKDANIVIAALMFDVTVIATAGIRQIAMQTREAGPLLGDVHMTVLAFGGRDTVNGCMAVPAAHLEFGVRIVPTTVSS